MGSRAVVADERRNWFAVALIVAAFLSSGAWLVIQLPPVPISKALQLLTVGAWLLAVGAGAVAFSIPGRRVLLGLAAVGLSVGASFIAGGSWFAVAFYDLYGNMPLVQWLAFTAVFAVAAGLRVGRNDIEAALQAVVGIGCVLCAALVAQQLDFGSSFVFGTTGYSSTALAPLVPVAAYLGATRRGGARVVWFAAAAFVALTVGVLSGTRMGLLAGVFAVAVSVAASPLVATLGPSLRRAVRYAAAAVVGLLVLGLLFVSLPVLSERWVNEESLSRFDQNVIARAYMWQGAERMVADRPLVGFGPSGYRVAAVEYLAPEAVQFGPEREGSVDPAVYSPQSPHSLLWEIATRLGLLGVLACGALLLLWALEVRERVGRDGDGPTAALRVALGAALLAAAFSTMVNPVLFPIGLFAPAAAGLAVAPLVTAAPAKRKGASRDEGAAVAAASGGLRTGLAVAGVVFAAVALWLGVGEWRLFTAPTGDANQAIAAFDATRRVMPGHPQAERLALEARLLTAPTDEAVVAVQRQVEAAPAYIREFAPNLVSLAAYSLSQAEATGRTDLSWERSMLDRAAEQLPPIPSLVSERLRLAVLSGDAEAVAEALPEAQRWGGPYPPAESYIAAAEALLAQSAN